MAKKKEEVVETVDEVTPQEAMKAVVIQQRDMVDAVYKEAEYMLESGDPNTRDNARRFHILAGGLSMIFNQYLTAVSDAEPDALDNDTQEGTGE